MAVGKSTIGRLLSRELGYNFVDVDKEIESTSGMSISEIFATKGVQGFRKIESEIIGRLATEENLVISTGGGLFLSEHNRDLLLKNTLVIDLYCAFPCVLERIRRNKNRPIALLKSDEELEELFYEREKYYKLSPYVVNTTNKRIKDILKVIENIVEKRVSNV